MEGKYPRWTTEWTPATVCLSKAKSSAESTGLNMVSIPENSSALVAQGNDTANEEQIILPQANISDNRRRGDGRKGRNNDRRRNLGRAEWRYVRCSYPCFSPD